VVAVGPIIQYSIQSTSVCRL